MSVAAEIGCRICADFEAFVPDPKLANMQPRLLPWNQECVAMTRQIIRFVTVLLFAVGLTACSTPQSSESEQKIVELQKQLDAAKQEAAAARSQVLPAETAAGLPVESAATVQDQPASEPSTPSSQGATRGGPGQSATAQSTARERELAEQTARNAEQASRDRAATEQALSEQKAVTARQADQNAELRRQLEEMKPRELTLPTGTTIPVRTTAEISTKTVSNGSVFEGLLERDLVVDETLLAKAGSRVTCVVVAADKGGKVKGVASLSVAARSIAGVNGNTIAIRTDSYGVDAKTTAGKDAKRTGIATGAGAVIGAIAGGGKGAAIGAGAGAAAGVGATLATRGDAAVIPTETLIEFHLAAPASVVFRK